MVCSAVAGLVPATTLMAPPRMANTTTPDGNGFNYFCGGWPVQGRPLHWLKRRIVTRRTSQ